MGTAIIFILAGVLIYFFLKAMKAGDEVSPASTRTQEPEQNKEDNIYRDRYDDPDVKIIRDEIRNAVADHAPAVSILQALARIDGNTSNTERDIIFGFLNYQGAKFEDKHREWFYTSRSGEWYRAAEDERIDAIINGLADKPLQYRIDIVAAATAIVASGGKPKKREAETLEKVRKLAIV